MEWEALAKSVLRVVVGVAVGIPLLLYPLLYFMQEHMLFYPMRMSERDAVWLRGKYPGSEFTLGTAPGVSVHGWLRRPETQIRGPLLIYFGGNAEEVSWLLPAFDELPSGWSFLLVNYRGYGLSSGKPGEAALFHDALAVYDRLAAEFTGVAVMGRSLGSGVAVYLASQRKVCGSVLVSPYASIRALAQEIYPYVPVRWLLKHPFDSLARAPGIETPVLALFAGQDRIIPPRHAETLLAAWGGTVEQRRFARANHDSIAGEAEYWRSIRTFLAALPGCGDVTTIPAPAKNRSLSRSGTWLRGECVNRRS